MTYFRECKNCGVAFDVGRAYCVNKECVEVREIIDSLHAKEAAKAKVKAKGYLKKPVPLSYTRLMSVRRRAYRRGMDFDLTIEFVELVAQSPCIYCGSNGAPSELDRKNNLRGYTQDNVVPACRRCNTTKNMYLTFEEMMKVAVALGWKN